MNQDQQKPQSKDPVYLPPMTKEEREKKKKWKRDVWIPLRK